MAKHPQTLDRFCDRCGMDAEWYALTGDPCLPWPQRVWRRLCRGWRLR